MSGNPGKGSARNTTNGGKKYVPAIFAVLAISILLLSSMPVPASVTTVAAPEDSYSGDYHVVRYHLNYDHYKDAINESYGIYNSEFIEGGPKYGNVSVEKSNGTITSIKCFVDVVYYGSIVSTEYNPQLWAKTIPNYENDITGNWLEIEKYKDDSGVAVVFTGWLYNNPVVSSTNKVHYPGEVLSEADMGGYRLFMEGGSRYVTEKVNGVEQTRKLGSQEEYVIDVYATWGTVDNVEVVSNLTELTDAQDNFDGGNEYTNFILLRDNAEINVSSGLTTNKPMTIRTEPVAGFGSVGLIRGDNNAYINAGQPLIIDDVGLKLKTQNKHGNYNKGISGCGYPLIIGTGIMSYYNGSQTDHTEDRNAYPTLRGGTTSGGTSNDWPVSVYGRTGDNSNIASVLIVHSGTWANIIAGSYSGATNGSVYSVLRTVTVLDTYACGGTGNNGNDTSISGNTYGYMVNANVVADTYEQKKMNLFTSPHRYDTNDRIPWPFVINGGEEDDDRAFVYESTVITGGGGSSGNGMVSGDTNVFISGSSVVWDAQAAGRSASSKVGKTAHIELSGKAISCHILCGSSTDGTKGDQQCVKNTWVVVKDSSKSAIVCGGGYDTYDLPGSSMSGKGRPENDKGWIKVEVLGGIVGNVYGGGLRSSVGTSSNKIDSISIMISGGTVRGNVYGGGSGGFDKPKHDEDGLPYSQGSGWCDTTGISGVYCKTISIDVCGSAVVEGNVYGGGKSVPAIESIVCDASGYKSTFDGKTLYNGNQVRNGVAVTSCDDISISIREEAKVGGVFGAGRGIKVLSSTELEGVDSLDEYTKLPYMTKSGELKYMDWYHEKNWTGDYQCRFHTYTEPDALPSDFVMVLEASGSSFKSTFDIEVVDEGNVSDLTGGGPDDISSGQIVRKAGEITVKVAQPTPNKDITASFYDDDEAPLDIKVSVKKQSNSNANPTSIRLTIDPYDGYALVNCKTITVKIGKESTVDSSVYGAGGRSRTEANIINLIVAGSDDSSTEEIKGVQIGDSVFVGGMKESLVATSAIVSISGITSVANSVYGAGAEGKVTLTGGSEVTLSGPGVTIGDSVFGGGLKESLTASSILVNIVGDTTVNSCVYGAGSEGEVDVGEGTVSVHVGGKARVSGSVFGGGLKAKMYGNTDLTIDGEARILSSVYGGGDVGERDQTDTEMEVLVSGSSNIYVHGSYVEGVYSGPGIAKSIIGGGNSCLVGVNRTVLIEDYVLPSDMGSSQGVNRMESLQSATRMDIVNSTIYLDGRGIGATASPSLKYSLYDIYDLRLVDGSNLGISQEVDGIRSYGSYVKDEVASTFSNPSNTIVSSGGVLFNTGYSVGDYRTYGLISGYTILSKDVSDEFYGAYAYGSQQSTGHFVQIKNGLYELIQFVDREGEEDVHDQFRLWTTTGAFKQNRILVATYRGGSGAVIGPEEAVIMPMSQGNGGMMLFTGATVSLNVGLNLVSEHGNNQQGIQNPEDACILVGYGDDSSDEYGGFTKFNYEIGTDPKIYSGVPITGSFAGEYPGSDLKSISRIVIGMWYNSNIPFTGEMGEINLEFQEVIQTFVDNSLVYIPISKTEVIVTLYCVSSPNAFAKDTEAEAEEVGNRHKITILIDGKSGSGDLTIPDGFYNSSVSLYRLAGDSDLFDHVEMLTASNKYGTSGWEGATGAGGLISICKEEGLSFAMSGSFSARLEFGVSVDDENVDWSSKSLTLYFVIISNDAESPQSRYFVLTISFREIDKHIVEFYAPAYKYESITRMGDGVEVIPPLFSFSNFAEVKHGERLLSTDYPVTYDYFRGWYLDPDCTKYFDTTSAITSDLKLYGKYAFEATFHLNDSTSRVYYEDIISDNIARFTAIYEDTSKPVEVVYNYNGGTKTATHHFGQTYSLTEELARLSVPTGDVVGWMIGGKVYRGSMDSFTVYSEDMELVALYASSDSATVVYAYADNSGSGTTYTVLNNVETSIGARISLKTYNEVRPEGTDARDDFVGWSYSGSLYEPSSGNDFIVSDEYMVLYALFSGNAASSGRIITGSEVMAHPGSKIYLPIPAVGEAEGFRGWMIGGAFYYPYSSELEILVPTGYPATKDIPADADVNVAVKFMVPGESAPAYVYAKKCGDILAIPDSPYSEGSFYGWYYDGYVYQPGDMFVVLSDKPKFTSDTIEFVAMFNDADSEFVSSSITTDDYDYFIVDGHVYPKGVPLRVPNGVEVGLLHEADVEVRTLSVQSGEHFRGWKVGDAYYFTLDRKSIYVVSVEDEVAIPVYENSNAPAEISFVYDDGSPVEDLEEGWNPGPLHYGRMVTLPNLSDTDTSFEGWYSNGFFFPKGEVESEGYEYVITDVFTEFTAIHSDSKRLNIQPGMLYVLHGNMYTYDNAPCEEDGERFIYVPSWANWDYSEPLNDDGNPRIRTDITIKIDFGSSLDGVEAHPGQTVELPFPVYEDGFKGWLAGGELYEPDENGVCEYVVQERYSYMRPLDPSDATYPGYQNDGYWYDDKDCTHRRFVRIDSTDGETVFDDLDRIIEDTDFYLKWTGNTIHVISVKKSGSSDYSEVYNFFMTYGEQFAEADIQNASQAALDEPGSICIWEVAKKDEDNNINGIGTRVYAGSKLILEDYKGTVFTQDTSYEGEVQPMDTLYILATVTTDYIEVDLSAAEGGIIDVPTSFYVAGQNGKYTFRFNEGHLIGNSLVEWWLDGDDSYVYDMGEEATVREVDGVLYLYHDGMEPKPIDGRVLSFVAHWKPMKFVVEVQQANMGEVQFSLSGADDDFHSFDESSYAIEGLPYMSRVYFRYNGEGYPVDFYKWKTLGEGDVVRPQSDSSYGYLDVVGDASVSATIILKSWYVVKVIRPAKGYVDVSDMSGNHIEPSGYEQGTNSDYYRIPGDIGVNLNYVSVGTGDGNGHYDVIYRWGYNINESEEPTLSLAPQPYGVIVRPFIELAVMEEPEQVYAAFSQNDEGHYRVVCVDVGSSSGTVADLDTVVVTVDLPDANIGAPVHVSVPASDAGVLAEDVSASWEDGSLVILLDGIGDVRGHVVLDLTLDSTEVHDPEDHRISEISVSAQIRANVFIVGPVVDGGM